MVRYRRNFVAGGTFFFTVTLADRRSSALIDHVDSLRAAFRTTRQARPFAIDAVVVLPDRLHVVMTLPAGDADFPNRWRLLKRRFTDAVASAGDSVARNPNGELSLWQRRFWEHTIRDDRDYERHVDYIHFNPVKHGLVARVGDWPYSSFHRYVRSGILPNDWAGDISGDQRALARERSPDGAKRHPGRHLPPAFRSAQCGLRAVATSPAHIERR
jgi:putative transposase